MKEFSMVYIIPELNKLEDVESIRQAYLAEHPKPNSERIKLINLLSVFIEIGRLAKISDNSITDEQLRQVYTGAYLFCLEQIAIQYRTLNPEFKAGWIYNSGSKLYSLLLEKLGI